MAIQIYSPPPTAKSTKVHSAPAEKRHWLSQALGMWPPVLFYHPALAQVTDACALFPGCAKASTPKWSRSSGRASATALGAVSHNDAARARSEFCRLPCSARYSHSTRGLRQQLMTLLVLALY
ncbi:hypothetical protein J3F84DRAFT_240957 [Trichoderma pleuroticola]